MRPQRPSGLSRSVLRRVLVLIVLLSGGVFVPWLVYAQGDQIFVPLVRTAEEPGEASEPTPISTTGPPASGGEAVDVTGPVFVYPRSAVFEEASQPIEYVVLLDTSGSTNWNFAGQAGRPHNAWQCTYNPATPNVQLRRCGAKKWNKKEERRIYIAKQAIMRLVDTLGPNDAMQIIGFSGGDYRMDPSGPRQLGTAEGKAALKQAVLDAGHREDPYEGGGGTPTPRALLKARELFFQAPPTAPNGAEYQQVLLLLTDGIPNHFDRRYTVPWGNNQWFNRASDDPACAQDPAVSQNTACQTGYVNDNPDGIKRPVTSMIYHGQQLQESEVSVYTMMLGAADTTGLDRTASQPTFPWYSVARAPEDVEAIIESIIINSADVPGEATCTPQADGEWVNRIAPEHQPPSGSPFGYLIVYDQNNVEYARVPISHDETTGLSYTIEDLQPGRYIIKPAWVDYVGEDGVLRQYSRLTDADTGAPLPEMVFEVPSASPGGTMTGPGIYLDLDGSVCPNTPNPPPPGKTLDVMGSVFLFPRSKVIEEVTQPIEYVVLLDTSGSTSWNFAGQARKPSNPQQCTFNPATPNVPVKPCGGKKWNKIEERRIYIAKQAVMEFIDDMNEHDAMQIIGFSSRDYEMEPSGVRELGTAQGKAALKQAVLDAGHREDPYEGGGGTTTASALLKARELFANAPSIAPNGAEYQRVLLLLTDGIPNHFDQKYNVPWGDDQWFNRAKDDPECAQVGIGENVACQTGYVNDDPNGIMRPITSMIYHGEQLRAEGVEVYAMLTGAAEVAGLEQVASQPTYPWLATVRDAAEADNVLAAIRDELAVRVEQTCTPSPNGEWVNRIEPEHEPPNAPEYGTVVLYDENDVEQARVPIMHHEISKQLMYEFKDLLPGTYTIKHAWVNYVGDDGEERTYSRMTDRTTGASVSEITFDVSPSDTLDGIIVGPVINLDLDGNVCPRPR